MADDQDLTPKWRRKGTFKWFGDDETEEDLIKGKYTIEFKPLKGYKTPEDMEVEIHENECLKIDVVYKKIHITGSLQITVLPDYEIVKDFKWRAKGTTGWFSSGETQNNITPGVYDVEFLETEFCKVTDPVKVNILESYVTKLNYTVIVTGPPGIIEVEPGIKDIKEVKGNFIIEVYDETLV